MKKIVPFMLSVCLIASCWQNLKAQCPYDNVLNNTLSAPVSQGMVITDNCIKGGQFDRFTGMQAGFTYRIATCRSWDYDTRLTVYPSGGGTILAFDDDY